MKRHYKLLFIIIIVSFLALFIIENKVHSDPIPSIPNNSVPFEPSTDPEMFKYILLSLKLQPDMKNIRSIGQMDIIPLISNNCPPQIWGEEPTECIPFGCVVAWKNVFMSLYLLDKAHQLVLVWGYKCPYIEKIRERLELWARI